MFLQSAAVSVLFSDHLRAQKPEQTEKAAVICSRKSQYEENRNRKSAGAEIRKTGQPEGSGTQSLMITVRIMNADSRLKTGCRFHTGIQFQACLLQMYKYIEIYKKSSVMGQSETEKPEQPERDPDEIMDNADAKSAEKREKSSEAMSIYHNKPVLSGYNK